MEAVAKIFIDQIKPDDQLVTTFLCTQKNNFVGKTGQAYLSLKLTDKTGSADAKVWDRVDQLNQQFDEGDYVKVKATATMYNGKLQLRISNIKTVPDDEIDPTAYFPTTSFDVEQMFAEVRGIYADLKNKAISRLILSLLDNDDFVVKYKRAPAAKTIHHPFLGGLLEHTLSLVRLARLIASHYPNLDESLLLAGVFFHDIGKTRELSYDRGAGYTDEGRLIGHITIGVEMLNDAARELGDFPEELRMLITHMILAHHGELEFGSPKRPKILEAFVLSMIDDMDARINSWQSILDEETTNSRWSNYQRLYDRYLYRWQGPEVLSDPTSETPNVPQSTPTNQTGSSSTEISQKKDGFSNSIRISTQGEEKPQEEMNLPLWKKQK